MRQLSPQACLDRLGGSVRLARIAVWLAGGAGVAHLTLSTAGTGDYSSVAPVAGDNAGPAIDALIHGHLSSLVSHQPLMGLTSIIARAPFSGIAAQLGAGGRLAYGFGALVCLLPAVLLAAWIVGRPGASQRQRLAGLIAAGIVLAGPATAEAVHIGHPEEVLAAVLATGAVVAATRARASWAWVLLGLAVGTKQWAVLAAPCVLVALPDGRRATAAKAAALALVLSAALPLAAPAAFSRADAVVGGLTFTDPFSLWWPLGSPIPAPLHAAFVPSAHLLPFGFTRSVAAGFGLVAVLGAMWLYRPRREDREARIDPLALLALCGLARCVTDPDPLQYNFVALLIPLATWEAVELGRLPLLTAMAMGSIALLVRGSVALNAGVSAHLTPTAVSLLSIGGSLTLGAYLTRRALRARGHKPVAGLGSVAPAWIREGA
ncbi:MAG: hypothetical protein M3Z06_16315 [Actinomycetota bacterium]|nr:hypothetical protein [Actinomycetota bacterium]